jgi:hypothetical protein
MDEATPMCGRRNSHNEPNGPRQSNAEEKTEVDSREDQDVKDEAKTQEHTVTVGRDIMKAEMFDLLAWLRQVPPLTQRAQRQVGWDFFGSLGFNSGGTALIAGLLTAEHVMQAQIVLMVTSMVGIPCLVFSHKIFDYKLLWLAHKHDMDDRKITLISFQLSTSIFTFPTPMIAVLVSNAVALRFSDGVIVHF